MSFKRKDILSKYIINFETEIQGPPENMPDLIFFYFEKCKNIIIKLISN
jgi:hypothetical protein